MSDAAPTRPHRFSLFPEDLATLFREKGVAIEDAASRRLTAQVMGPGGDAAAARRPVGKRLRAALEEFTDGRRLELVERTEDPFDHFVKYLLRAPDGGLVETVRIPLHKPGCFTVCLSSQVGCAMACGFCATGRMGLTRNLEVWEMVDQLMRVRDDAEREGAGRVTGAVFMGQGEPLQNYDRVMRAAHLLRHPCGGRITAKGISISTVGLVPAIRRYAAERQPFRLIVSLTSTVEERRARLLPVASRWSLEELSGALREYAAVAPGLVTVAWVLMGGVNHDAVEVEGLRRLLGDLPLRVNLIDVNDPRPGGFRRATDDERREFVRALQILKAPVVRRYSGGTGRHAACGMLAATRWEPGSINATL
jgi:23S rRNA (adenine2503-C2)-methyltransferase